MTNVGSVMYPNIPPIHSHSARASDIACVSAAKVLAHLRSKLCDLYETMAKGAARLSPSASATAPTM
eukprot:7893312-Alexandrium_andersonii.AAC.1